MKLSLFNTTQLGKNSPIKPYIDYFLRGYTTECSTNFEVIYLNNVNHFDKSSELFESSENIIFAFEMSENQTFNQITNYINSICKRADLDDAPALGFVVLNKKPKDYTIGFLIAEAKAICHNLGCHYNGMIVINYANKKGFLQKLNQRKKYRSMFKKGVHFGKTSELI